MARKASRQSKAIAQRRWTAQDAQAVLRAASESGYSLEAYAKREGLWPQRLYRWRRQLTEKPVKGPAFVEVVAVSRQEPLEVVLRSGRVLRISEKVDVSALARIADALDNPEVC